MPAMMPEACNPEGSHLPYVRVHSALRQPAQRTPPVRVGEPRRTLAAPLFDQLQWLREAGFATVDCLRATADRSERRSLPCLGVLI